MDSRTISEVITRRRFMDRDESRPVTHGAVACRFHPKGELAAERGTMRRNSWDPNPVSGPVPIDEVLRRA